MREMTSRIVAHGVLAINFPFSKECNAALKSLGGHYSPEDGRSTWRVPADMWDGLINICREQGWRLPAPVNAKDWQYDCGEVEDNGTIRPHQLRGLNNFRSDRRFILNWDTGLGKSYGMIRAFQQRGCKTVIISCPGPNVREEWRSQLAKWWPEAHVRVVGAADEAGDDDEAETETTELIPLRGASATVVVTSYRLLSAVWGMETWDGVGLDELHYLAHKSSGRSSAIHARIADLDKNVVVIGATATFIANEVGDLWSQVEAIRPGSWGTSSRFFERYCDYKKGPFGILPESIRLKDSMKAELQERIEGIASQVRKQDLPVGELPAFEPVRTTINEPFGDMAAALVSKEALEAYLESAGSAKVKHILARVQASDAVKSGRRLCVGVYHKRVGCEVYDLLAAEFDGHAEGTRRVFYCDGDMTPKARAKEIATSLEVQDAILIATMPSVGIGINTLIAYSDVLVGELYWVPAVVEQFLGRFHRLGSAHAVKVEILVLAKTPDERMAQTLERRLTQINSVLRSGTLAEKLEASLKADMSFEDFLAEISGG